MLLKRLKVNYIFFFLNLVNYIFYLVRYIFFFLVEILSTFLEEQKYFRLKYPTPNPRSGKRMGLNSEGLLGI